MAERESRVTRAAKRDRRAGAPAAHAEATALLIRLHHAMLRIRLCEEALVEPIVSQEVRCPVHLYSGQEAVAVGVCAALTDGDMVFGTHRSHGHYLAMGGDLRQMVAEIFCRETGCSAGRGGSMHLVAPELGMMGAAPIVAGTISLAVGAALAAASRGEGRVAVSFFGDGAAGEGVLYESLNFAALRRLPLFFVCENNLYSTHLRIDQCRVRRDLYEVAQPFGIPARAVDGNDVVAVHDAAREAVERARRGGGPTFLECRTYRLRGHVGPDDNIQGQHTDIRPLEEVAEWTARDPILALEGRLRGEGMLGDTGLAAIRAELETELAEALAWARASRFPPAEEVGRHVFRS